MNEQERSGMRDRIADALQKNAILTNKEGYQSGIQVVEATGGYAFVTDEKSDMMAHIIDDPRGEIRCGERESIICYGRMVIENPLAEEKEVAQRFRETGNFEANDDDIVVKFVPHEIRVDGKTYSSPLGQKAPSYAGRWFQAIRPFSFTTSLTPVILGGVMAWYDASRDENLGISWFLFPAIVLAGFLYHVGTNLVSDYYDHVRRIDKKGSFGGSRVLTEGLLPAKHVFRAGIAAFIVGSMLGIWMLMFCGWPLLALGMTGLLGGFFYCGGPVHYKYRGLGEVLVFILMGPLMVLGSYYVLTNTFVWNVFFLSLPIGFLVTAILQANDLRDIPADSESGIHTVSVDVGPKKAAAIYYGMIIGAYVSLVVTVVTGIAPAWELLALLSIPAATKAVKTVSANLEKQQDRLAFIDAMTAQVHLQFGLLMMVGLGMGTML